MQDIEKTEYKRRVYIDNKRKRVYKHHAGYQELNEADQEFFDEIFEVLWFNETISLSNAEIGEKYGFSPSTVQKKLKRCQEQGLVHRKLNTVQDPNTGRYSSEREISLDPMFKAWLMKELRLQPKGLEVIPEPVIEEADDEINLEEEIIAPPVQSTGKNGKKKQKLKRFSR